MPYYRLEALSRSDLFDEYFQMSLQYTQVREIDDPNRHGFRNILRRDQAACGLWMLQSWQDVLKFWENEPPGEAEAKSTAAADNLINNAREMIAGRFVVRIADAAFTVQFFQDLPLIHLYPSSVFHMRTFDRGTGDQFAPGIRGVRIPEVVIDDRHVEVYFQDKWYTKSYLLSRCIREVVRRDGNIASLIPNNDCFGYENGNTEEDFAEIIMQFANPNAVVADANEPTLREKRHVGYYIQNILSKTLSTLRIGRR